MYFTVNRLSSVMELYDQTLREKTSNRGKDVYNWKEEEKVGRGSSSSRVKKRMF